MKVFRVKYTKDGDWVEAGIVTEKKLAEVMTVAADKPGTSFHVEYVGVLGE